MTAQRISCIMASRGDAFPAACAIECYRRQTYADRELLVVTEAPERGVEAHIAALGDPSIRCLRAPPGAPVGLLRNQAIAVAHGDLVCIWDDDDLSHPRRLEWQYAALAEADAIASVIGRLLLWWPDRQRLAVGAWRTWENTLLVRRSEMPEYPAAVRGSDTSVIDALIARQVPADTKIPAAYVYVSHGRNLWDTDHFEMLFRRGDELAPEDYAETIAQLAQEMPIEAYLAGLAMRC